jgi:hypothetical protein
LEKLTPRTRKPPPVRRLGVTPRPVKVFAMLMLPVILAMIVACDSASTSSNEPYSQMPEGKPPLYTESRVPDPKEALETKPAGILPEFIALSPVLSTKEKERTTSYYQGAMDHYDSYKYIPCYCGCAIYTTPHKNLAECFIKSRTEAGETVFTDHSLTCSQCQEAAKLTLEGTAAGTPLKDIRTTVHNALNYTQIWTDTPPVP